MGVAKTIQQPYDPLPGLTVRRVSWAWYAAQIAKLPLADRRVLEAKAAKVIASANAA